MQAGKRGDERVVSGDWRRLAVVGRVSGLCRTPIPAYSYTTLRYAYSDAFTYLELRSNTGGVLLDIMHHSFTVLGL